jgi:hypothetical protein
VKIEMTGEAEREMQDWLGRQPKCGTCGWLLPVDLISGKIGYCGYALAQDIINRVGPKSTCEVHYAKIIM